VLLRRHYGISARDYLYDIPDWEVDLLVDAVSDPNRPDLRSQIG
jgi:hypothetical protein